MFVIKFIIVVGSGLHFHIIL